MSEKDKELVDVTFPPQSSIKLVKYAKGYGWEIKVYCDDLDFNLGEVERIDKKLRQKYGQNDEA